MKLVGSEPAVLIKQAGSRCAIRAQFSRRGVVATDVDGTIAAGDVLERSLPHGAREYYVVLEVATALGLANLPPIYDCKVRRRGGDSTRLPDTAERDVVRSPNVRATTGPRFVVHAGAMFDDLREAVRAHLPEATHADALSAVAAMQQANGTEAFSPACARFLGLVADHLQAFHRFMPALVARTGWDAR
jgi:hypothetical protein